ncbi:MAG: hypothetical protein WDO12_12645 [Pseudomonadota bacterium]
MLPETVARLARVPRIVAIKEAVSQMSRGARNCAKSVRRPSAFFPAMTPPRAKPSATARAA